MPLESANFIDGLVITNPPGTDLKSQGDDHLQLIKKVLKNTFPGATKPFTFPSTSTKTTNFAVTGGDQHKVFFVDTAGGAVTMTLPVLTGADEGWRVTVIKNVTNNPLFIVPPSGFIQSGQTSVAKARRMIPYSPFDVVFLNGTWWCERIAREPVTSVIPFFGASLPMGYEWPNGQVLVAANYPEYAAARGSGTTPDLRQRSMFGTTLGGSNPDLINPGRSGINGTVLESAGGTDVHTLTIAQLASHGHGTTESAHGHATNESAHSHALNPGSGGILIGAGATGTGQTGGSGQYPSSALFSSVSGVGDNTNGATTGLSIQGNTTGLSINNNGGNNAHQNMPPAITCNYALIVE